MSLLVVSDFIFLTEIRILLVIDLGSLFEGTLLIPPIEYCFLWGSVCGRFNVILFYTTFLVNKTIEIQLNIDNDPDNL